MAAVVLAQILARAVDVTNTITREGRNIEEQEFARIRNLARGLIGDLSAAGNLVIAIRPESALPWDVSVDYDRVFKRSHSAFNEAVADARDGVYSLYQIIGRARGRALELNHAFGRDGAGGRERILAHARIGEEASILVNDLAMAFNKVRDLENIFDQDRTWSEDRARALVESDARRRADVFDFTFGHDLQRARENSFDLVLEFCREFDIAEHDGLAEALLSGVLDDFSQADLSRVDLSRFNLAGVRWSMSGTRWPRDWREALLQQSKETEPGSGTYVVLPLPNE